MKSDTLNFAKLFSSDVQYVVPMFQRPYVWEEEKQWEPLWQDIMEVFGALQDAYERHPDDQAEAERQVPPHFLGAVVLDPLSTGAGKVAARHVIDGQQRLTTLQLLLAAVQATALDHGLDRHARIIDKLLKNDKDLIESPEQRYKVWPTKFDRESFMSAMQGAASTDGRAAEAYRYFREAAQGWAEEMEEAGRKEAGFDVLVAVLREFLKLVAIDLEPNDNAQAIFEALNARGTELLAVDLVKNLAFRLAEDKGEDVERLYSEFWQQFDTDPWREEVRVGRLRKARADQYLTYWLVMKTARDVHAQQVFPTFRRLLLDSEDSVESLLADLSHHAKEYDLFSAYEPNSVEGRFFSRIDELDITTVFPLALLLFGLPESVLPKSGRRQALRALESWLVRRMLIRANTKDYNKVFPILIGRVQQDPSNAAAIIIESLRTMEGPSRMWPRDADLRDRLLVDPVYGRISQARVRMVLGAVENWMRGERAEEFVGHARLHIEHILPQHWKTNWPPPPDADPMFVAERDAVKHRLGNLTLLTSKLNAEQSNAPWERKQALLNRHSVLLLNRNIADQEMWDEEAIHARGGRLIEAILQIWSGPNAEHWIAGEMGLTLRSEAK